MPLLARFLCIIIAVVGARAALAQDCPPSGGVEGAIGTATSGTEFTLDDGRRVRLAGLFVPSAVAPDARRALGELLSAGRLRLVPLRAAPDRYGRLVAHAVVEGVWTAEALAGAGLGLADLFPGEAACAAALLAAEARARAGRRGIWAISPGPALPATEPSVIRAQQGRFILVEGRIVAVGVREVATFLDFGRRWTEDFAVVIPRAERARIEAVVGPLSALVRRSVRVRGVVEPGQAPRLRIVRPEAIEVLD
jgi:endonuclease YncB( thermonuclease family)